MDLKLVLFTSVALLVSITPEITSAGQKFFRETCIPSSKHTVLLGRREYGDGLMFTTSEMLGSQFLFVQTKPVNWRHTSPGAKLTYIEILNQLDRQDGGCIELVDGGIGKNYLNLMLHTQRSKGLHFDINAYGFDPNK